MSIQLAAAGPSLYWYLTRSTGAVALLLLTLAIVLGVIDVQRWSTPRWPRFVVDSLHRNVSLLAMAFLGLHILTSVLDSFAPIALIDAFVPFVGSYRPFWLGLGAVAFDLLLAVIVTSLLRHGWGLPAGAPSTGSPTRAGRSRCCTVSAPAATSRAPGSCR